MLSLNDCAWAYAQQLIPEMDRLGIAMTEVGGASLLDFGIAAAGSLDAGLALARLCLADCAEVSWSSGNSGGTLVKVTAHQPWLPCLAGQYAGWSLSHEKFFALGSGPMRAAAAVEPLFAKLDYSETPRAVVGVLETRKWPPTQVICEIANRCKVPPERLILAVAPTASIAGTVQVVARALETALHKLHELEFDVKRIVRGTGIAPLPPLGVDDFTAMGWTNDAVLYGGEVELEVAVTDEEIECLGPRVPSCASPQHGRPFAEIFRAAGGDFYQIDPLLFSPARVTFRHPRSGRQWTYGRLEPNLLAGSGNV